MHDVTQTACPSALALSSHPLRFQLGWGVSVLCCSLQGYAMPLQIARGLHIRLYARAFVFAEHNNSR
jgi:hypothetical protein